jgi:hypothetical protein
MRRKLLVVLVIVLIIGATAFFLRNFLYIKIVLFLIKPSKDFAEVASPFPPDYSLADHWAALPDREDNADVLPAGDFIDNQAHALVDAFFIHPTTYYSRKGWNQPLDDRRANKYTDRRVLRNQASAYNGSARVYAPRYRQATLYSFLDNEGNGSRALDLAYEDVKHAFEYYLENYNSGRPIIIASHSQGSRHAIRLLRDYFSGKALREKLVAAYLIGWTESELGKHDAFPDIPVCGLPDQTGCWLTWNTMGEEADRSRISKSAVCVNPLTWMTDTAYAGQDLNLGGVVFSDEGAPAADVGIVSAQCSEGVLWISTPEQAGYSYMPMGRDNYHIYDYSLFYVNIRTNVQKRVAAYFSELDGTLPEQ